MQGSGFRVQGAGCRVQGSHAATLTTTDNLKNLQRNIIKMVLAETPNAR